MLRIPPSDYDNLALLRAALIQLELNGKPEELRPGIEQAGSVLGKILMSIAGNDPNVSATVPVIADPSAVGPLPMLTEPKRAQH